MADGIDKITEPQEWIDGLILKYAPYSGDIDVAIQNMGLRIKKMEDALTFYALEAEAIGKNIKENPDAVLASVTVLSLDSGKRAYEVLK